MEDVQDPRGDLASRGVEGRGQIYIYKHGKPQTLGVFSELGNYSKFKVDYYCNPILSS